MMRRWVRPFFAAVGGRLVMGQGWLARAEPGGQVAVCAGVSGPMISGCKLRDRRRYGRCRLILRQISPGWAAAMGGWLLRVRRKSQKICEHMIKTQPSF